MNGIKLKGAYKLKKIYCWGLFVFFTLLACQRPGFVLVSGRIENGDSVVAIWVKDSVYTFPLDENRFFSGKMELKKGMYASLMPNSVDLFLCPGEDIEIYTNRANMQGALVCKGSLGGINTYLKEQEMTTFVSEDDYRLEEEEFVGRMENNIEERIQLLRAKNFNSAFTRLEERRIRFSVGEKAVLYPLYHRQLTADTGYQAGKVLRDFLASVPVASEELFVTRSCRKFLLSYVYFQNGFQMNDRRNYPDGLADYVLEHFRDREIRNFLLSEMIYRYVWENNGVKGAEYMLDVFRKECSDPEKLASVDGMLRRWERLEAGREAPAFVLKDREGKERTLAAYEGRYVYLMVWASWCMSCKKELPYIAELEKKYRGRNISFLTVSIDGGKEGNPWKEVPEQKKYAGLHALWDEKGGFRSDYMVGSVPRFILIDPEGRIMDADAPRPSEERIHTCLEGCVGKSGGMN